VPSDNCIGANDVQTMAPTGPPSRQQNPQESVGALEAQTRRRVLLENRELVRKRDDLRLQGGTGSKTGRCQSEKGDEKTKRELIVIAPGSGVERKWGRQRKLGPFEGGNAVKWTIRIEVTQDGKGPTTRDVGTITRSIGDLLPEQIGLTVEEGQQLLHRVQMAIIGHQVHGYEIRRRLCDDCGRRQRIKDTRRKCVQTAFGAFRLRGRRYRVCQCQPREIGTVLFPLGEIIPRRTTPEVRFLFAELGATMPYREASRVLRTCGFGRMRASHAAIRRHTIAIGRDLEAQRMSAVQVHSGDQRDAAAMVVGIDDTYVRHRERLASRQIQITAGRVERNGALGARFAFVSASPSWNLRQIDGFLEQQGRIESTTMRVVTDGDDGLHNLVERSMSKPIEAQLDWFHIGMRLEHLRKVVSLPVTYREYLENPEASEPMRARVSRLRDALWRGRPWRALLQFARLRRDIDRWLLDHPHTSDSALKRAQRTIEEFQKYVCGNRRSLPDYAKQRAAGHRISTAHVESVMNHLVNHRLSKKQQMRWSRAGAHYLLQVRAELLNGTLLDRYRVGYPRFRGVSEFVSASS